MNPTTAPDNASAATDAVVKPRRYGRWTVAVTLLCLAAYPASEGPVHYAVRRGWVSARLGTAPYRPLQAVLGVVPSLNRPRSAYLRWWHKHMPWSVTARILPDGRLSLLTEDHWGSHGMMSGGGVRPKNPEFSASPDGRRVALSNGRVLLDGEEIAVLPPTWSELEVREVMGRTTVTSK